MSLEKIVAEAMAGKPLEMKEAFQEEISARVTAALEEKYKKAMEAKDADEDSDDEDADEDEDEDDVEDDAEDDAEDEDDKKKK